MKKSWRWLASLSVCLVLIACGTLDNFTGEHTPHHISKFSRGYYWYGGTARFSVTPEKGSYIAGFRFNRRQTAVHDNLYVSCVAVSTEVKNPDVVFVSVDVIGLMKNDIDEIRHMVTRVAGPGVIISATHTHSGPDTIGFWGKFPILTSGRNESYMTFLKKQILRCIEGASKYTAPIYLTVATATGGGLAEFDTKEGDDVLDLTLGVLQGVDQKTGAILFTLANFGAHPDLMRGTEITADFPYGFYTAIEKESAGMGVFINGAQGNVGPGNSFKRRDWKEMERLGRVLAERALDAVRRHGTELTNVSMFRLHNEFLLPVDNIYYEVPFLTGTVPRPLDDAWHFKTEVNIIRLGQLTILTVPGEIFPSIAKELRSLFSLSAPVFIFGLTGDELGYAMTKKEYDAFPQGNFHRMTSPGRYFGEVLIREFKNMLPIFFEHLKRCFCTAFYLLASKNCRSVCPRSF